MGILQGLIEQSRLPSGFVGRCMLRVMNHAHKSLTHWGVSQLDGGQSILDASCGAGAAIRLIAGSGKFERIYGIDLSDDAVDLATKYNKKLVSQGMVSIQRSSVLELPFDNHSLDAVITIQSHYHWPDVLLAVKEIHKKLKPRGQFVIVAELYKMQYHMNEYNDVQSTKKLLGEGGFTNIKIYENPKHLCIVGEK